MQVTAEQVVELTEDERFRASVAFMQAKIAEVERELDAEERERRRRWW